MLDVLRFWLDRGVDGFRIDVVYKIAKDPELRDDEPGLHHDEDWPTIHPAAADPCRRRLLPRPGARRRGLPAEPAPRGGVHQHRRRAGPGPQLRLLPPALAAAAFRASVQQFTDLAEAGGLAGLVPGKPRSLAGRDPVRRRPGKRATPRPGGRHDDLRAARHPVLVLRAGARAARCRDTAGTGRGRRRQGPGTGADAMAAAVPGRTGRRFTTGEPWLPVVADAECLCVEAQEKDRRRRSRSCAASCGCAPANPRCSPARRSR